MNIPMTDETLPFLTTTQMIEIDRLMIEDSGIAFEPAIRATATMTLALPKAGLRSHGVEAWVGELYLADIGVPPQLYTEPTLGLTVGYVFAQSDILRLW